jgi:hypothetical protein
MKAREPVKRKNIKKTEFAPARLSSGAGHWTRNDESSGSSIFTFLVQ